MTEDYELLKEKYKKKCERVSQLLKRIERLKNYKEESMPLKCFKVTYNLQAISGFDREFTEILTGYCAADVVKDLAGRRWVNYKLLSIEKIPE